MIGFAYQLSAQQPDSLTPPSRPGAVKTAPPVAAPGKLPFAIGESLTFNVAWASFGDAARIEMQVVDQGAFFGHDGFQLQTRVHSAGQARSVFLELDNRYTSYVHSGTMLPHRLDSSIKQGAKQTTETAILDQQGRTARFADESTINLQSDTFDLTSLIYALRVRGLSVGAKARFAALYGKEIWDIEAEAKEQGRVRTPAGIYEATAIDLTAKGRGKYRVRVWLSNDAHRLPVSINARLSFGEVRAELSSVATIPRPRQVLTEEKVSEGPKASGELFAELERSRPFSVGERLSYQVSWAGFVSVGKASFSVRQRGWIGEQRVMELMGEASTNGNARSLINVDDQLISFVDVKTLFPVRTETRLSEGSRKKEVSAHYNTTTGAVRLTNGTQFKVAPGTLDLVSLFYAIRAAALKPGAELNYTLLGANHRMAAVKIRVVKQERISVPFGTTSSFQLDILDGSGKSLIAQAWISDDQRRLPLYIVVRTRFGQVKFELTQAIGTR